MKTKELSNRLDKHNLYASAPELLEALKSCQEYLLNDFPGSEKDLIVIVRTALAKAEGR